jgi:hypothetical protein
VLAGGVWRLAVTERGGWIDLDRIDVEIEALLSMIRRRPSGGS